VSQPRFPEVESLFVPDTIYRGDRDKQARQRSLRTTSAPALAEQISSESHIQTRSASVVPECGIEPLELPKCVAVSGGALVREEHRRQCPCRRRRCTVLPVLLPFSLSAPMAHWAGRGHGKDDAQDSSFQPKC